MKRVFTILLCICVIICFSGCGYNASKVESENNDGRMTVIYNDGYILIHVDNETGCQYVSRANAGTCLMVDENGKPLIYEMVGEPDAKNS